MDRAFGRHPSDDRSPPLRGRTVGTEGLFPAGLFTTGLLDGSGVPDGGISTATLGSNTSISSSVGGGVRGSGCHVYGTASTVEAAARCTKCAAEKITPIANELVTETQAIPEVRSPRRSSGTSAGQIEPKGYLCTDQDISLATVVTRTGRVRIWIANGSSSATGNINVGGLAHLRLLRGSLTRPTTVGPDAPLPHRRRVARQGTRRDPRGAPRRARDHR